MIRLFAHMLIFAFTFPALGATERIIWNKPHWPPYYIAEGPKAGQGHLDKLLAFVANQNKDLSFDSVRSELGQLGFKAKDNERSCNGAVLLTPEREVTAYFTAFYIQPPVQLILQKTAWKKTLYESKVVSFKRLIDEYNLHGVFSVGRSYGDPIDVVLRNFRRSPKLTFIPRTAESLSLVNMVSLARADYTLEYPEVLRYMEDEKLISQGLTTVEIEEQRNPLVVYIACPRTEWGKKAILLLDKAVQKAAASPEFKTLMESWYPDQIRARYRRDFDEFYKKRSTTEWTTVPFEKK